MEIKTQGICKLREQKDVIKNKILLEITQENFEIIKKLQPLSCTKLEIGDFITKNQEVFDSKGQPKSFVTDCYDFAFNKQKTYIVQTYKKRYHYSIIQTQEVVDVLKSIGFSKAKIGKVFILINAFKEMVISLEKFTKEYKILEENLVEEK